MQVILGRGLEDGVVIKKIQYGLLPKIESNYNDWITWPLSIINSFFYQLLECVPISSQMDFEMFEMLNRMIKRSQSYF